MNLPATAIDLSPLITELIKVAALIIGVLGTMLLKRLFRLAGLKSDVEAQKLAEPILQNALAFGQQMVSKLITEKFPDLTKVEVKDEVVRYAVEYAIDSLKKELQGVSRAHVERMLAARLEANISAQTAEITATAASAMPTTVAKPPDPVVVPVAVAPVIEAPKPRDSA